MRPQSHAGAKGLCCSAWPRHAHAPAHYRASAQVHALQRPKGSLLAGAVWDWDEELRLTRASHERTARFVKVSIAIARAHVIYFVYIDILNVYSQFAYREVLMIRILSIIALAFAIAYSGSIVSGSMEGVEARKAGVGQCRKKTPSGKIKTWGCKMTQNCCSAPLLGYYGCCPK